MADTPTPDVPDPRDLQIQQLEAQLQKAIDDSAAVQKDANAVIDALTKKLKAVSAKPAAPAAPAGDAVVLGGVRHAILGTFRADNTFAPVKQGFCEEGITLVAIAKVH